MSTAAIVPTAVISGTLILALIIMRIAKMIQKTNRRTNQRTAQKKTMTQRKGEIVASVARDSFRAECQAFITAAKIQSLEERAKRENIRRISATEESQKKLLPNVPAGNYEGDRAQDKAENAGIMRGSK